MENVASEARLDQHLVVKRNPGWINDGTRRRGTVIGEPASAVCRRTPKFQLVRLLFTTVKFPMAEERSSRRTAWRCALRRQPDDFERESRRSLRQQRRHAREAVIVQVRVAVS